MRSVLCSLTPWLLTELNGNSKCYALKIVSSEPTKTEPLVSREDFPLLRKRTIEGRSINYLDSAATTLKPQIVIDAILNFYEHSCGNIHRGDHTLSREASDLFEEARHSVARFIGAFSQEVVFTSGTSDGLNLVADGLRLEKSHNIVVSELDHHSNILPWMAHCEVRFLPVDESGRTDVSRLGALMDDNTKLVSLGHVSNVTGAINDVAAATGIAHARGVPVCIDAAQSVPHIPVDVVSLDCDFLVFSGHKLLGPSGIGALYIKENAGRTFHPRRVGGGTPDHVRKDGYDLKELPYRLEVGTPNIEGAIGMAAAIEYLDAIGMDRVAEHDAKLSDKMQELFGDCERFYMLGPKNPEHKLAVASLVPRKDVVSVGSIGHFLSDSRKIMARSGTHCAHPYFESLAVQGSIRLSPYVYSGEADLCEALEAINFILGR